MSCQRSYWFRVPLTKHIKRDSVGHGEATINNAGIIKETNNTMTSRQPENCQYKNKNPCHRRTYGAVVDNRNV